MENTLINELTFYKHCFHITALDKKKFDKFLFKKSTKLQKIRKDLEETYGPIAELISDVFIALYRYSPEMVPENKIRVEYFLNFKLISTFIKSSRYKEIRNFTKMDEVAAISGTELFIDQLLESLDNSITEYNEIVEQIKDLQNSKEGKKTKTRSNKKFTLEEVKEGLDKAKEKIDTLFKDKIKSKLIKSIKVLSKQQQEMDSYIKEWGLGNDGTYQKLPYQDKIDVLNKLKNNPKLKEIAKLTGRLKSIYLKGEKENKKSHTTLKNLEQGNNISRTLPSEFLGFTSESHKALFLKKYTDKNLLQYNLGDTTKKGMGPIIVLMDCSGSMQGENEIFTKAIALSLLNITKRQKRSFLGIHFSDAKDPDELIHRYFKAKEAIDVSKAIEMAEYFESGGTNFEVVLDRARSEVLKEPEFLKADIIILTDGCSAVRDSWLKEFLKFKEDKNIKVTSILMDRGYSTTKALDEFSNNVMQLKSVTNEKFEAAKLIFKNIF